MSASADPLLARLERADLGERVDLDAVLDAVRWNDAGLVPAVAQQHDSGEVLMLAWMDRATLTETLTTGRVCYYSRSRGGPWRKGETSGHVQQLIEARLDCDGDALLLRVDQQGPACHTGRRDCFYLRLASDGAEIVSEVLVDPDSVYGRA
jgi:phosphoribosyl-AMP cyclohydrolase